MKFRVSVVIPTFHRPDLLCRCLDAVLAQTVAPAAFEIIVVDDGHDDATRDMVDAMAAECAVSGHDLRYLRPRDGHGPAAARNTGWRAARSPLIAFTDDDTVPQPMWLAAGERSMYEHPSWAALCGRINVPLDATARASPTDHELMTLGLESAEFVTANAFVRLTALQAVDGFDEAFKRAWREDSDLQFRLMQKVGPVGRSDDAVVWHPVRAERWGVSLRQQRNALFDALLYKKHPLTYRERIHRSPPWNYYGIVANTIGMTVAACFGRTGLATGLGAVAMLLVLQLAWSRLRPTSHAPAHVVEMLATSAVIPFLSVYWRLRGAAHYRTFFL